MYINTIRVNIFRENVFLTANGNDQQLEELIAHIEVFKSWIPMRHFA